MSAYLYNPNHSKLTRRELRQQPVACERLMWQKIRNKQIGFKFKRQYGIGRYVVDFYCPEIKLVIEIDGTTHFTDEEIKNDKYREYYLNSLGLSIKRYMNIDIKERLLSVVNNLRQYCEELKRIKNTSSNLNLDK